jgi:tetratricopeptide (TPR) repeat protein
LARTAADAEGEALALVGLSRVAFRDGEYARVVELARSARTIDDTPSAPLHMEAAGNRLAGNLVAARALYEESLARNRGGAMEVVELHNLLHVELHLGEPESARGRFVELERLRKEGDAYNGAMRSLNLAAFAYGDGDRDAARAHLDACTTALSNDGIALDPDDQYEVDRLRDEL